MATPVELDPVFIKALEYLRCKTPDSTEKLNNVLTEVIEHSKKRPIDQIESIKLNRMNLTKQNKTSLAVDSHKKERDMAQKRQYDKIQRDLDELNNESNKKFHPDLPEQSIVSSSNIPNYTSQLSEPGFINDVNTNQFGSNTDLVDPADFELEMEGLACIKCSEMTVGSGNQLVECQECHNLYHQDCHNPYVSDAEVNDPRCIWYCSTCKKSMKKQEKQNFLKTPSSILVNSNSNEKHLLLNETKNKATVTPFKRSELKTNVASSTSNVSMSGWAALSGKPIPSSNKQSHEHITKSSDNREKHKHHKEKTKSAKAHSKQNNAKMIVSDVWAEALGAQNTPQPVTNNNSKHIQLSSGSWLSGSHNSNNTSKSSANLKKNSHKSSAFPKASASSHSVEKSSNGKTQNPDSLKRLHPDKKKPFSKIQSKRKHV